MINLKETFFPSHDLSKYILSYNFYSVIKSNLHSFMVPEGALELVIQLDSEILQKNHNSDLWVKREKIFIGGLHQRSFYLNVIKSGQLISIRFRPGGFAHFTKHPVNVFKNTMVGLDEVRNKQDNHDLLDQLISVKTNVQKVSLLECYLKNNFRDHRYAHLANAALDLAMPSFLPMDKLAYKYNLSSSRFRNLFGKIVGCSPKQFFQTRRISAIIRDYNQSNSLTQLALQYGYYDQAHFIHNFNSIVGCSPSNFSRNTLIHDPVFLAS